MRRISYQSTPLLKRIPEYQYFCYVTNIEDESPLMLHRLYRDHSESENWIEQAKNQLFASNILTQHFWTNEALFLLSILAYIQYYSLAAETDLPESLASGTSHF
jgi:hypothetical protein